MFEKLIGKHRVKKYKGQLDADYDIKLDELINIFNVNKANFLSWEYSPHDHGHHKVSLYHKNLEEFDIELAKFVEQLAIRQYIRVDSNRTATLYNLDDWLVDYRDVPVNWKSYSINLLKVLTLLSNFLKEIPEKKQIFYHRNAYFLRADLKVLLKAIIGFQE